jgi:hypothetical protein
MGIKSMTEALEEMKKVLDEKTKKEDASNDKSDDGEGIDKVDPKAAKKKFADRKDKDLDNDGDTDSSDEYLHKRRKAIGKSISDAKVKEAKGDDEAKSQGMFIVLEKGSKNKVIGQFKDKKKTLEMKNKNAGSKVIQIGKFATTDDKPVDIKVGDELSYTRVKLATKVKEENNLIAATVGYLSND